MEAEVLAMAGMIDNARRRGDEIPWNVADAFAKVDKAIENSPECEIPADVGDAARKAFRAMKAPARAAICQGWSMPATYLGEKEAMAAIAQTYDAGRCLRIESRSGEAPSAYHEFLPGGVFDGPVSVQIREGASRAEAIKAITDIYIKMVGEWPTLIDHRTLKDNGPLFADADERPGVACGVFDAVIAAADRMPALAAAEARSLNGKKKAASVSSSHAPRRQASEHTKVKGRRPLESNN